MPIREWPEDASEYEIAVEEAARRRRERARAWIARDPDHDWRHDRQEEDDDAQ